MSFQNININMNIIHLSLDQSYLARITDAATNISTVNNSGFTHI